MDLKEYCNSLPKTTLSELALRLCKKGYPIWETYSIANMLSYLDTVIGEQHVIEKNLLVDTLYLCADLQVSSDQFTNEKDLLLEKFSEPITAIQDEDWILPYTVEKVFFAIYNLLKGFVQEKDEFGELAHYLSVNQAVDAIYKAQLMTVDELKNCIYNNH